METSPLFDLAQRFELVKLHVTVQLQRSTTLPDFKGSMWHGWFGHALKAVDEHAFVICYGEHDQQQPKPYMITPDQDHKTDWKKGELLSFELTLFGQATQLADSVMLAIQQAENTDRLGLGRERVPFRLISVASQTPQGRRVGVAKHTLADWLMDLPFDWDEQEIALQFLTPMRVKLDGKILKNAPPKALDFWVKQMLRRWKQLSQFWVIDDADLFEALYQEIESLPIGAYQAFSHTHFEDWQRYSLKQQEQLPFGGLKGQVGFVGDIAPLLPLFKIGELLHLGGKTTFGLGQYRLLH